MRLKLEVFVVAFFKVYEQHERGAEEKESGSNHDVRAWSDLPGLGDDVRRFEQDLGAVVDCGAVFWSDVVEWGAARSSGAWRASASAGLSRRRGGKVFDRVGCDGAFARLGKGECRVGVCRVGGGPGDGRVAAEAEV